MSGTVVGVEVWLEGVVDVHMYTYPQSLHSVAIRVCSLLNVSTLSCAKGHVNS